jgi:hypothetical protein
MKIWSKLAAAMFVTAAIGVAVPSAAQAGTVCSYAYTCEHFPRDYFNGGKLSVDFDGQGNNSYNVRVYINGNLACQLPPIYGNNPPESWTCNGMPAGSVRAWSNSGQYAAYHDLGVRYYQ